MIEENARLPTTCAGAGTRPEELSPTSPLWSLPQQYATPLGFTSQTWELPTLIAVNATVTSTAANPLLPSTIAVTAAAPWRTPVIPPDWVTFTTVVSELIQTNTSCRMRPLESRATAVSAIASRMPRVTLSGVIVTVATAPGGRGAAESLQPKAPASASTVRPILRIAPPGIEPGLS